MPRLILTGRVGGLSFDLRGTGAALLAHGAQVCGRPIAGWSPPKDSKGLIEDRQLLRSMHQQATQRVVEEVGLVSDLDMLERLRHVERPSGLDIQTQFTQKPGEVENVLEELAHSTRRQETGGRRQRGTRGLHLTALS